MAKEQRGMKEVSMGHFSSFEQGKKLVHIEDSWEVPFVEPQKDKT